MGAWPPGVGGGAWTSCRVLDQWLSYCSLASRRHHDGGSLQKGAFKPRGLLTVSGWEWGEGEEQSLMSSFETPTLTPSNTPLLSRPHPILPKQCVNREPSIQTVGLSLIQTTTVWLAAWGPSPRCCPLGRAFRFLIPRSRRVLLSAGESQPQEEDPLCWWCPSPRPPFLLLPDLPLGG